MDISLPAAMAIVFVINIIPAFMPPTWVFLAYVHIAHGGDLLQLALLGALFSTMGRVVLAKWSGPLVDRFFNSQIKKNVEFARDAFNSHPSAEFAASFVYALSPFPSNTLFIVTGAAKLRLARIVAGFFAGRVISYYFLMLAANFAFSALQPRLSFSDPYTIAIDVLGIALAIAFLLADWRAILGGIVKKKR